MGLSTDVRRIDDTVIVAASGHFSTKEGTLFRHTVKRYADDGSRKFILNLREVFYIDSSGFGELFRAYTTLRNIDGEVVFMNPSKMVKDLLAITKLSTVFHIVSSSMSRPPETRTAELAPKGERRMGANPHANGGILLQDLRMPDFRSTRSICHRRACAASGDTPVLGRFRDVAKLK